MLSKKTCYFGVWILALLGLAQAAAPFNVLLFTYNTGIVHASIPDGITAITALGKASGFSVEASAKPSDISSANLARFKTVVFMNTTGDVLLDAGQKTALEKFVQAGGGWVGLHGAAQAEFKWTWFGGLLGNGAWFKNRSTPNFQTVTCFAENKDHFIMSGLPDKISINDEFYGFEANPRSAVKVLFRADETSYVPGPSAMGDHPAAWAHEYDGGRAVYTTMGHFSSTYADPSFKKFLTNAILWSAHQEATTKIYFSQTKNIQVHSGLFQFDLTGRLRETRPNYFSLY